MFFVLAYLVAGCSLDADVVAPSPTRLWRATSTTTVTPSAISPTETKRPTRTPTPDPTNTATPTSTPTPVSLPIRTVIQRCLTIQPDLPLGFLSTGKVLFSDLTEQAKVWHSTAALTPQEPLPRFLPNVPPFYSYHWGSYVSPSRKLLAYKTVSLEAGELVNDRLIVIDADGQVRASMDWENDWYRIEEWLDVERLVLTSSDYEWAGVYIVNPFTDQSQRFDPPLQGIYYIDPKDQEKRIVWWKMVLEPSLTRVGYVQHILDDSGWVREWRFVLWDLQNDQELGVLDKISYTFSDRPTWSPDGSQLAVVSRNRLEDDGKRFELFIMDWNGETRKWVDLRGNPDIGLGKIRWSPDGRYIAIGGDPFIILDMVTRQVWDYCISAGFFEAPIYWSPDSKQVLVTLASLDGGGPFPSIVIDVKQGIAAQLYPDPLMEPIGWLALP